MVLMKNLAVMVLVASFAMSAQAQLLAERHVKALNADCIVCHEEKPASKAPAEVKCIACHGDLKTLGEKPLPEGAINPHLNHVDELYCADCHHMHKPSENYCLQCHDDSFLGMKVP